MPSRVEIFASHPKFSFTQVILHEMMVYHNEVARNYLTVVDVNKVLERILERGEAHFKHIWAEFKIEVRDVLRGMTEHVHHNDIVVLQELRALL